jgi:hypothetical protein
MRREYMKSAVVGVWVLAWSVIALSVNVSSAIGWVLLVGSALLPPLVILRLWRPPAQTISESIRDVLK